MTTTAIESSARTLQDRRRRQTPMLSRYWMVGRRRGGRRTGELTRVYVDRYQPVELILVLAIMLFSALDLGLTLLHLEAGGVEANPVMAWFLDSGSAVKFAVAKLGATTAGALVLLIHARFRAVRGVLWSLTGLYVLVMLWHAVVIWDRVSI